MADQEQDKGDHPFHVEGQQILFDKPEDREEAARKKRESEQHEFARSQVEANIRIATFTKWLVVATFLTIVVGLWQGIISQKAANAARDAASASTRAAATSEKSLAETQRSNAVQEKRSQDSLQASIDALQQEQRAWVGPTQASPPPYSDGRSAVYIKAGEPPLFWFMISNSGKTPAHDITSVIETHVYSATEKFVPVYRSGTNLGTVGVQFPGVPMQIESLKTTGGMDAAHIALLTEGKTIYYVYGKIAYTDIFGKPHKTEFCSYVRQDLASLVMCPSYNAAN